MILFDKVGKWKRSKALAYVREARCILVVVMSMLGGLGSASAFTTLDRDACWSAWTNAFYYTDSSGRGYLRADESSSNGAFCGSWTFTSEIEVVDSAVLVGLATPAMVNGLLEGWTNQNGLDWSSDPYNDDVSGEARAFISGYQVTGNTNWLTLAKYGFDLGYSRGISTNGGVLECTSGCVETAETADGMLQVAYFLAQYLPDPTYLTKAEGLYGFLVTNEFVASTGMIEGTPNDGVSSTAASDYGFFMYDSILLGHTNNAYLAAAYATNAWGLGASGTFYGSPGFFLRAMGLTGIDTNFGIAVCDNAWSWRNSRGLSEQWTYRESETNVDYCYDTMDLVMGMLALPPDAPPTLPVTANDVVGSQVTFTAAFPCGMTYQWQKISGGVTNNLLGATNMTLTLGNLQLTDTASYQLLASNSSGIQVSFPNSLTVSNVPTPVNNVIASYAAQTGLPYGCALTPTWTLAPGSLIAGQSPSSANGNFNLESLSQYGNRDVDSLTMGGSLTVAPDMFAPDYETYTATFTATASTETLAFVGTDLAGGDNTVFIDNVQVVSAGGVAVTVPNFGFETPSLGTSNYQYNVSGGSWTFSGNSGIVAKGSGFGNINAPQGVQAGFVQMNGTISQAISGLTPGTTYTVTFSAAQRPGNNQTWNVTIGFTTPPSANYTNYAVSFTASASSEKLAYVGTDLVGGDNTVFIDNVQIISAGGASVTVPNFGFETPSISSDQYNPSGGSWTFGGASPNGSGIVHNGGAFGNANSPQGVQAAFIQEYGTVSQTISGLTPGTTYTNTFYASERPGNNQTWNVTINGAVIGSSATVIGSYAPSLITSSNVVTCGGGGGAGSNIVYTLPASAQGYYLTNVTVYGGWASSDRDVQAYSVYYSTVLAPTNFILLGSVNFDPVNAGYNPLYNLYGCVPAATRTMLTPATGALATNVAAIMFNFTSPTVANDFGGYTQIQLFGVPMIPMVTTNTLPATAADVVGSQVTFTAGMSGVAPLTYQWQKISGGVTNNIVGATNTTLTLSNLQLTDTASYQLVASNANGVAVSMPSSLAVSSVPSAVNNVVTDMAAQTGASPGSSFTPTWTLATNSLIASQSPSATNGDFNMEPYWGNRNVNSLTAGGSLTIATGGSPTTTSTNYVSCGTAASGAGQSVTYSLTGSASGYNLTNITVYGGWRDNGRDQQGYTVYCSTVAAPGTFNLLGSVYFNPANAAAVACATRATLTPANGPLATNVVAVEFNFTTPTTPNGWCGYSQIQVFGIPTFVTATNPTNIMFQVSGSNLTLNWPADHTGWQLQVQTNSTAQGLGTNWFNVADSSTTNQIIIPINTANGCVFYRLIYP